MTNLATFRQLLYTRFKNDDWSNSEFWVQRPYIHPIRLIKRHPTFSSNGTLDLHHRVQDCVDKRFSESCLFALSIGWWETVASSNPSCNGWPCFIRVTKSIWYAPHSMCRRFNFSCSQNDQCQFSSVMWLSIFGYVCYSYTSVYTWLLYLHVLFVSRYKQLFMCYYVWNILFHFFVDGLSQFVVFK